MLRKKRNVFIVVAIILLVIGIVCLTSVFAASSASQPSEDAVVLKTPEVTDKVELEKNPIDFTAEMEKYPDIYAWIKISGTDIDFPVVQHPVDDSFYLDHNAEKESDDNGAIYTELCNNKDFQDPVTVIYGHNMNLSGKMLNQLLLFEDEDFFDNNQYFEIYTPGHILRYKIISAYMADDRHIMNSFDFSNNTTRRQYFDSVCNPKSLEVNSREEVTLEDSDKIVQISTCMTQPSLSEKRYILTGVLVETRLTT